MIECALDSGRPARGPDESLSMPENVLATADPVSKISWLACRAPPLPFASESMLTKDFTLKIG